MTPEELTSILVSLKQPSKVVAMALVVSQRRLQMWLRGSRAIPDDIAPVLREMAFGAVLDMVMKQNREALADLVKR